MQGLMLKLLNVDAEGERALRVVSYFDQLTANQPDLESVVRAAAILADCTAGLRAPGHADSLRFTRDGDPLGFGGEPTATAALSVGDHSQIEGLVWLERTEGTGNLDAFILERMALTAGGVLRRHQESRSVDRAEGFSDPALADLLINERAGEVDRSRAARLMGLDPSQSVQLLAIRPASISPASLDAVSADLRTVLRRTVHVAQMTAELVLAVAVTRDPMPLADIAVEGRIGVGPVVGVVEAPASWARAREALRFAGLGSSWPDVIESGQLGSLSLLLGFDPVSARADPDVLALQRLHDTASGDESMRVLDLYLHSDSLRSAARAANFHHSSIQSRLLRIEKVLGMELRTGTGRQRAAHALLLWQLFHE